MEAQYKIEEAKPGYSIRRFTSIYSADIPADDENFNFYRQDARRILDQESNELNALGISRLIAALIAEYHDGYHGKENS